ncbi:MAG: rRNA maturation RNase YbeY [Gallionella sp.]
MNKIKPAEISLTVQYACNSPHSPTRAQFRKWIGKALVCNAHITLRIVDATEGRQLNKQYRNKDYATNVLTFVYDETPGGSRVDKSKIAADGRGGDACKPSLHGDVVICAPVVEQEAEQQHKTPMAHYAHLAVHAALHLQGYQHEEESDAIEMESIESALMLKLGFPDPYEAGQP